MRKYLLKAVIMTDIQEKISSHRLKKVSNLEKTGTSSDKKKVTVKLETYFKSGICDPS